MAQVVIEFGLDLELGGDVDKLHVILGVRFLDGVWILRHALVINLIVFL
jgi:hypothetical protein